MKRLVARLRDVQSHDVDDSGELIVHDASGKQLLVLNETGAAIFELLDGERDVSQIAALLADTLEVKPEPVRADVERFVRDLAARGIADLQELG